MIFQKIEEVLTQSLGKTGLCPDIEAYNEVYGKEIELNGKYQSYVLNFKTLFEGKNAVRFQVLNTRGEPRSESKYYIF